MKLNLKLDKCPFCGHDAYIGKEFIDSILVDNNDAEFVFAQCRFCGLRTEGLMSKAIYGYNVTKNTKDEDVDIMERAETIAVTAMWNGLGKLRKSESEDIADG